MSFKSNISAPNEVDVYSVHLVPDKEYIAVVADDPDAQGPGLSHAFLAVFDPTGGLVAAHDGFGGYYYTGTDLRVPVEGDYLLMVGDRSGATGSYETSIAGYPELVDLPGVALGETIVDPVAVSGLFPEPPPIDYML